MPRDTSAARSPSHEHPPLVVTLRDMTARDIRSVRRIERAGNIGHTPHLQDVQLHTYRMSVTLQCSALVDRTCHVPKHSNT